MNKDDEAEQESAAGSLERYVVFLVDDQKMVAEGIRRMLEPEGDIEFHYCNDPKAAVEMGARVRPTVILQDLVMPDVSGMMLVRFFRKHPVTADVPIIVLSSKEAALDKSEAFSHGASDYLVKLPDRIELIARIRAHSRSYLAQVQRDEAYKELRALKTQLEEKNEELERLSSLDGLTGIPNRRIFDEVLDKEWKRAAREHAPLSLLLIDIDYFKLFNDTYGHQGGDDCLAQVAKALDAGLRRGGDMAARYGGEEFAVILPATDSEGAAGLARALCEAVNALNIPHEASKVSDHVTISVGVATWRPDGGEAPSHLVSLADEALYRVKDQGRNGFQCADAPAETGA